MGFLGAKIERFTVPIEIERESEKRMGGHSAWAFWARKSNDLLYQ